MNSVMKHSFSQVPQAQIPRSSFNRSHGFKTTFDAGYLVPVFVDEALPGDTFNLQMTTFARLLTPIVPIMDNMVCDAFFFAVPIRLVWDNFKKMMGEQANPDSSTSFLAPIMSAPVSTGYAIGSLSDYFGIPTGIASLPHSSLWHRAYNLVYNEWYRDQNLQNSVVVDKDDGPDDPADYILLRRGKRHDYFTSCLPWPQKGTAVAIPLGSEAPLRSKANATGLITDNMYVTSGGFPTSTGWGELQVGTVPAVIYNRTSGIAPSNSTNLHWQQPDSGAGSAGGYNYADLSEATAATINSLRQAFQIQKLYERDARGGTRYTEIIRSHFGVVSPDARLQRPEYLGGGSARINIHPVAQTSGTQIEPGETNVQATPQGNLAAIGTFSGSGQGFTKSFTEHTLLLGLISVRADLNYQQGLNRMFSRRSRFDWYWPALSHLGEQAVLFKEIWAQGPGGVTPGETDDDAFGYQERFAEYRYKPSVITGKFRSTASGTLDIWHLAQKFTTIPKLNATFIVDNPPITRIVAVESEPQFQFDAYFNLNCVRPMPTYSVPGLIDHF